MNMGFEHHNAIYWQYKCKSCDHTCTYRIRIAKTVSSDNKVEIEDSGACPGELTVKPVGHGIHAALLPDIDRQIRENRNPSAILKTIRQTHSEFGEEFYPTIAQLYNRRKTAMGSEHDWRIETSQDLALWVEAHIIRTQAEYEAVTDEDQLLVFEVFRGGQAFTFSSTKILSQIEKMEQAQGRYGAHLLGDTVHSFLAGDWIVGSMCTYSIERASNGKKKYLGDEQFRHSPRTLMFCAAPSEDAVSYKTCIPKR